MLTIFRVKRYRLHVAGFVAGVGLAVGAGLALAGGEDGESLPSEGASAPIPESVAPPDEPVTPITEPNYVGTYDQIQIDACYGDLSALGPGQDGVSPCEIALAVDQGQLEPGQELSNAELQEGVAEVESQPTEDQAPR